MHFMCRLQVMAFPSLRTGCLILKLFNCIFISCIFPSILRQSSLITFIGIQFLIAFSWYISKVFLQSHFTAFAFEFLELFNKSTIFLVESFKQFSLCMGCILWISPLSSVLPSSLDNGVPVSCYGSPFMVNAWRFLNTLTEPNAYPVMMVSLYICLEFQKHLQYFILCIFYYCGTWHSLWHPAQPSAYHAARHICFKIPKASSSNTFLYV